MKCHADNLQKLPLKEKFAYLIEKLRFAPAKTRHWLWLRAYRLFESFNRDLPETLRSIEQLNYMAALAYVPRIYAGRVALFWASGDLTTAYDQLDGWRVLAHDGIEVHEIPGSHIDIIKEPHVGSLAEELRACLDQVPETLSTTVRAA
jgi:aspartate racemase